MFDFDGDDNSPNAAASANVQDGDGFDTVTGFTPGDPDTLILLMNESGGDNSMAGYLQNSGSTLKFVADSDGNVDVTLGLDIDDNGTIDASITFNDYFNVADDLGGTGLIPDAATLADFALALSTTNGVDDFTLTPSGDDGLNAGDTLVVHNITDTQFGGLFGEIGTACRSRTTSTRSRAPTTIRSAKASLAKPDGSHETERPPSGGLFLLVGAGAAHHRTRKTGSFSWTICSPTA